MNSEFVKMDNAPFERSCVEKYSKMDIDTFYSISLPKIARRADEKWSHFQKRRNYAEKALDTFIFGKHYNKTFELLSVPEEYLDYHYSKHSEFGYCSKNMMSGVSISLDIEEIAKFVIGEGDTIEDFIECEPTKPYNTYSLNKINENQIGYPFGYWKIRDALLKNSICYVRNNSDNNGCISVTRWITATGKSGRTKEIESLVEGCKLSWTETKNAFSTEITVISPNNVVIGEINWKTDEDHMSDTEFNEVYEPLLNCGNIEIQSIKLKKKIPHNSPNGRPKKALAEVLITFCVQKLDEDKNLVEKTKLDIQSMRTLAAIDYNRKCDIIEGKTPEKISSLEELFFDTAFACNHVIATFNILQDRDFLSGSAFTIKELEEIWNVYMPIITFIALKDKDIPFFPDGKNRLFCRKYYFNYILEHDIETIVVNRETIRRNIVRLSLCKNE